MSTQFDQCVGVQFIWSINDNCLTLKNHPLQIVGILIPQINPQKIMYAITSQRDLYKMILPINIGMAPGLRLRPTLYYNHQL